MKRFYRIRTYCDIGKYRVFDNKSGKNGKRGDVTKAKAISSYGSGRLPEAAWKRLYEARAIRGTTQKQAAIACGVIQQTFSGWEKLRHRPKLRHRVLLAAFMNVDVPSLNAEIAKLFPLDIH